MNIEYENLIALAAVLEAGSFSRAAKKLFISQSAVSQRIKELENYFGESLISRNKPLKLSDTGEKLIAHYKQVKYLEQNLNQQLSLDTTLNPHRVKIAINNDSLEFWFLERLIKVLKKENYLLEVFTADDSKSHEYLKSGEVFAAISATDKISNTYRTEYLGSLDYHCLATKEYSEQYFKSGTNRESLLAANIILYDRQDSICLDFLENNFQIKSGEIKNAHYVRSSRSIGTMMLQSAGYALFPKRKFVQELKQGNVVDLAPNCFLKQKYYLHTLPVLPEFLKKLKVSIKDIADESLHN